MAFNGSLLHGAPSDLIIDEDAVEELPDNAPKPKKVMRMTFLVNMWVDHIPNQAVPYPSKKVERLTKSEDISFLNNLQMDSFFSQVSAHHYSKELQLPVKLSDANDGGVVTNGGRTVKWPFVSNEERYEVSIPGFPSILAVNMALAAPTTTTTGAIEATSCVVCAWKTDTGDWPGDILPNIEVFEESSGSESSGEESSGSESSDGESGGEESSGGEDVDGNEVMEELECVAAGCGGAGAGDTRTNTEAEEVGEDIRVQGEESPRYDGQTAPQISPYKRRKRE
jgi:hypothetical protein